MVNNEFIQKHMFIGNQISVSNKEIWNEKFIGIAIVYVILQTNNPTLNK